MALAHLAEQSRCRSARQAARGVAGTWEVSSPPFTPRAVRRMNVDGHEEHMFHQRSETGSREVGPRWERPGSVPANTSPDLEPSPALRAAQRRPYFLRLPGLKTKHVAREMMGNLAFGPDPSPGLCWRDPALRVVLPVEGLQEASHQNRDHGGPRSLASAMRLLERVCPPWGDAQASSAGAHDAGALAFVTKPFTHEGTRGGTCRRGMREEVMIVISLAKENVNISVVPLLPAESRRPFWARTPGGNVFCCDRMSYICSCLLCEQKWDTSVFIPKALYSHSLWRATNHTAPLTTPPHTFLLRFLSMSTVHGGQLASCRIHTSHYQALWLP